MLDDVLPVLISLLMPENMDAMVEASRVFGNFSRSREVRAVLAEHKGDLFKSHYMAFFLFHCQGSFAGQTVTTGLFSKAQFPFLC